MGHHSAHLGHHSAHWHSHSRHTAHHHGLLHRHTHSAHGHPHAWHSTHHRLLHGHLLLHWHSSHRRLRGLLDHGILLWRGKLFNNSFFRRLIGGNDSQLSTDICTIQNLILLVHTCSDLQLVNANVKLTNSNWRCLIVIIPNLNCNLFCFLPILKIEYIAKSNFVALHDGGVEILISVGYENAWLSVLILHLLRDCELTDLNR